LKIGEQLREHRDKAMLTQEELGKRAELSGYTISRIESDQVEPRVSTMRKIAGALGIEPEELTTRPKAAVLRETELRADTDDLVDLGTEDFADLLATLADGGLIDLQEQLMLLLRYRYAPKVVDTWEEARAYMQSAEKKRGDRAGELLRMAIKAIEARANERIEARTKALELA